MSFRINYLIILLLLILFCTACNKEESHTVVWGKTEHYNDFLFSKYTPYPMERKLVFDFNEDALSVENVQIGLFTKEENNTFKKVTDQVILYKNGTICPDNILHVSGNESEAMIGIEFTSLAGYGTHKWYFKVIRNAGLDRINEFEIAEDPGPVVMELRVRKVGVWNPLKLILTIILLSILALLLLWFLLLKRMFFPTFKVSAISITEPYFSMRQLKGCYQLRCTNKFVKQSFWSRLFKGRIAYEVNPFWNSDWVINPRDKASIKPVASRNYSFDPFTINLKRGTTYKVTNNTTGEKITMILN